MKKLISISIASALCMTLIAPDAIAQSTGGTISGYQTVCGPPNDPYPLNNNISASGSGNYSWQKSEDNGLNWTTIPGAMDISYDPPAGLTVTTRYRRVFTRTVPYGVFYSNTVLVSVCGFYTPYNSAAASTCAPNALTQGGSGVTVTNGAASFVDATALPRNNPGRLYTQHGIGLTNGWRLNFDFNYSAYIYNSTSANAYASNNLISLTNTSLPTTGAGTNPGISAMLEDMSPGHTVGDELQPYFQVSASRTNAGAHSTVGWKPAKNTNYYISVYYVNKLVFYVAYSDIERTQKIALFRGNTDYLTGDPNVQSLPFMQHGGGLHHDGGKLTGSVDNSCLSNLPAECAGIIAGNTTIACGSTSAITISHVSGFNIGGSVPFSYTWEYSTGTQWFPVSGSGNTASLTISTPPLTTTRYRRKVYIPVDAPLASTSFYFPFTSNEVTVTVTPPTYSLQETHNPGNATFKFIPSVTGAYIEHSSDNINWSTSGNAPDGSYQVSLAYPHYRNIYIRAKHASCGTGTSEFYHLEAYPAMITGLEKTGAAQAGTFSIAPNPGRGVFVLNFPGDTQKDIYVYDVMGKTVFSMKETNAQVLQADLSHLPQGVYLLKVISGKDYQTSRLVIE